MKHILSLLIALSCAAQAQQPKYTVQVIAPAIARFDRSFGDLYVPTLGINNRGDIIGTLAVNHHAFLYKNGEVTDLGLPAASYPNEVFQTFGVALNDWDTLIGQVYDPSGGDAGVYLLNAFIRKEGGKLTQFAFGWLTDGANPAIVHGINNSGTIILQMGRELQETAHTYRDGQFYDLGTLQGGHSSTPYGINSAGQIVGTADTNQYITLAFLYSNGRMQVIGGSQSANFTPAKINDHGEICGRAYYKSRNSNYASRYLQGSLPIDIDTIPGSTRSDATGINNSGEISGYCVLGNASGTFATGASVMGIPFPGQVPPNSSINVRSTPAGTLVGAQLNGVVGVINAGPVSAPANPAILNGVTTPWWNVTFPSGVSGWVGQIVLGVEAQTGFIYKDERMYDLSKIIPGWQITYAGGVNDNGQIACIGNRLGQTTNYALLLGPVKVGIRP
jgi:probable HAF family extracellular repeat protein